MCVYIYISLSLCLWLFFFGGGGGGGGGWGGDFWRHRVQILSPEGGENSLRRIRSVLLKALSSINPHFHYWARMVRCTSSLLLPEHGTWWQIFDLFGPRSLIRAWGARSAIMLLFLLSGSRSFGLTPAINRSCYARRFLLRKKIGVLLRSRWAPKIYSPSLNGFYNPKNYL